MSKQVFFLIVNVLFLLCCEVRAVAQTICLNMIVKDESHVITRVLDSVKGVIDYWVIVDTGSSDGTQSMIKECLQDVPGELFERPWKNFAYNRNEALELAKGKSEYLLFMDADDWLELDDHFQLGELTLDAYNLWWTYQERGCFSYLKPQIVKSNLPWKWVGVMHEYLTCGQIYSQGVLEGLTYVYSRDGARSCDPEKYLKAAHVLQKGIEQEPDNSRYVFYLAESYRDGGNFLDAIKMYEKRISMEGWHEEVFWSFLQIALIQQRLEMPDEEVIHSFYRAHRYRPHRAEPIYYLAEIYNQRQEYVIAYECLKGWEAVPKPYQKDHLFNMDWIEEYGLLFQKSICSYYLGYHQESLDACNVLLTKTFLPEVFRKQTEINRTFPEKRLQENL